jgi:Ca-activated chloride channel family protein
MQAIARLSGGKAFSAQTADQLSSIYKSLGNKLGSVRREKDIAVWWLAAAAVLLLLAVLASVRSAVKLP